jgi:thiol-disulfide isomerase/thioredoxin
MKIFIINSELLKRPSIYILYFFMIFVTGFKIQAQTSVRNFSLPDANNQNLELKDIQGEKLTVLDFWTSWCRPCLTAIPEIIKLHEKYDSLGVSFIGINEDGPRSVSKAMPLAKSIGVKYPIVFDTSGDLASEMNVGAFPTLIIINSQRKVILVHEGFAANDAVIIDEAIANALKK